MTRKAIPAATRALVWERDRQRCQICGEPLTKETVDIEHRLTVFMLKDEPERYNHPDNLYLICGLRTGRRCHRDKTNKDTTASAKVKRLIKKESGEHEARGRKLRSRGFQTGPSRKLPSRPFPRRK